MTWLATAREAKKTANEVDAKEKAAEEGRKQAQSDSEQAKRKAQEEEEDNEEVASNQTQSETEAEQATKAAQEEEEDDGTALFTDEILQEKAAEVLQSKYSM
eukprot:scaffold12336_cov191-Skeletonema_menzelii.AAC.2